MDYGHALSRTSDGGYILAGQTFSYGDTTSDTWLIKTDSLGNEQWMQTMGSDTLDGANSIVQTIDGGYFVVCHTEGYGAGDCDAWYFKTDTSGNILWEKTYGGPGDDVGEDGIQTSTGDYVVTGFETVSDWHGNGFIAKYNSAGNETWIRSYGSSTDKETAYRILETDDGGYAVAGTHSDSLGIADDIWMFVTNNAGDLIWSKRFGTNGRDEALGFCKDVDGGFLIAGRSTGFGNGDEDAYLIKVDKNGNQLWSRNYGGLKNDGFGTIGVTDGGYIAAGYSFSFTDSIDMLMIKTDSYGNQIWMKTIGSAESMTGANWLRVCDDGGYAILGNKQPIGSENGELYFIKTDMEGNTSLNNIENQALSQQEFGVYPNPATSMVSLYFDKHLINSHMTVYNSVGRIMYEGALTHGLDISTLCEGVYIICVADGEKILWTRLIKM